MPVIMGTAGHIDHGKTTLIKALTGIDCDRLVEEKKRGITIELGFAFMDLPGDRRLGIIDVPGHERFVKNMVAGAAGIDFVTLVIAADEGIMPQTREHLEICTLLGIKTGLVALTKIDMVDEEWLEMVKEDVAGYLSTTFLADAPIFPVSAHTGQGLDALKSALSELVDTYQPRRRSDLARLPIDRVFTLKGYGTVVTGTLIAGSFKVGDDVVAYPKGTTSKIRNLQSHGQPVQVSPAGRRTAVNLPGLEVDDLERGEVLALPGTLFPSLVWDVELTCLASCPRSIKHRTEIHFHHGTRETLARIFLLDREKLEPGETAICQVRFAEPMAGVFGDRCVVRAYSPLRTVAGGRIVSPLGRKVKRFAEPGLEPLRRLAGAARDEVIPVQLELAGAEGLSFARLMVLSDLESRELDKALKRLCDTGGAALVDREGKEGRTFVAASVVNRLMDELLAAVAAFHKREPLKQGVTRGEMASGFGRGLSPKLFHFLLERLLKTGKLAAEQEMLRLPEHKVSMASDQAKLRDTLLGIYDTGGLTPPNLKDVLESLNLTFKEAQPVYKVLMDQGLVVRIKEDMFCSAAAFKELVAKVAAYFETAREMDPSNFKDIAGLSRKFAIPYLEYMDKEKITVRVGDKRQFRRK
ncbi:selenocysteine-specific translation elongation factor [Desulfolutivibrio sulfoxidireducens]|uniref:selenocysteine-specific translation elongation factor n=1 Tax=Desulfolutivibrio sulfoxidireducens TaxID=2773299 RepID=UPI00159DDCF8|nr:selenocysteine-specific translation elongation factor [Desulfolutivibrio sulfoxidireducens]QLA18896.1 selenocysteine-specific translation elongation factor [Desulfolutivibrio sulfoxidireducens]